MPEISKGQTLSDRFELLALLGKGGTGDVWLAQDRSLAQKVALKILKPALAANADWVTRLRNECASARRLIHPNIVRVFDFHEDGEHQFISMEYVEGDDLSADAGRSLPRWIDRYIELLDAIEYAHGVGLVHRDIKTSNVLCTADGQIKLGDFGIGSVVGASVDGGGSPYSMSPQQLSGSEASVADDIYALGVMLYEMIDGKPPFYPQIDDEKIRQVVPPPPGTDSPLPDGMQTLVMRMLSKQPADRPASVGEIRREIAELTGAGRNTTLPPGQTHAPTQTVDTIEPIRPGTVSPGSPAIGAQDEKHSRGPLLALAVAAVVLIAALIGVFVVLPKSIAPPTVPTVTEESASEAPADVDLVSTQKPVDKAPGLAPYELAQAARDREEAEELVAELLRKQFSLEDRGVTRWAEQRFVSATTLAQEGDTLFRGAEYGESLTKYRESLGIVDELIGEADEVFAKALVDGAEAIEASDAESAKQYFELALAMEPGHPAARRGLELAAHLDEILGLMGRAELALSNGDMQAARQSYRDVLAINPNWTPASEALSALNRDVANQNYTQAMSAGFAALANNDLDMARRSFERANSMRPGSADAQAGLQQVDHAIRLRDIEALRAQAEVHAANEDWSAAVTDYQDALKIDPNLVFARQGLERAQVMERVEKEFALYFDQPERLATEAVYQGALGFLEQVALVSNPGPKLRANISRLETQLQLARVPVTVVVQSDNETQVFLYQVGKLGSFTNRQLELYPGEYTLVGTRSGYRDVRQKLKIVPGQVPDPVVVRCEEKI